jgi:hypothetical protein
MELRKLCLRIMLAALAAGAGTGVPAILAGGNDSLARIAGTAVIMAVAAGILFRLAPLLDKPATQAAGVVGVAAILFEGGLGAALMWEVVPADTRFWLLLLWVGVTAPPAVGSLVLIGRENARYAGWVGAASSAVVLALFLIATFLSEHRLGGPVSEPWMATAWLTGLFGLLATANSFRIDFPGGYWRWAGLACAAVSWIVQIAAVRRTSDPSSGGLIAILVPGSVAVLTGLTNVLLLCELTPTQAWVRTASILTAGVGLIALDGLLIARVGDHEMESGLRFAAAAGLLSLYGSLAVPVMARLNRKADKEPTAAAEFTALSAVCPMCSTPQRLPVGGARCVECGLRFVIQIVEPRCPRCDYLLYRIKSDRCPECGLPLSAPRDGAASSDKPAAVPAPPPA